MRRWVIPIMVFATTGLALSVTGLVTVLQRQHRASQRDPFAPEDPAAGLEVPAFAMTDQDGAAASESLLLGHVTILDFIFTNCPFVCPGMTMAMSGLS